MADRGRPTDYTEEIADKICEALAGGESLRKLCKERDDFPGETTVYRWLVSHEDFRAKYAHARENQTESHLEDIFAIADDEELKPDDKRVRIDARKWAMSKLAPKKYGDKTLLGNDPDNPLPASTDNDTAKLVAFLLTKESRS